MSDVALTRYLVLLVDYADGTKEDWDDFDAAERAEIIQSHGAFAQAMAAHETCRMILGEELELGSAATVLRRRGGRTILTEGSFSESIEQVGGFYVIDAPDLDTLVGLLELMPAYVMEIRPAVPESASL